MVVPVGVAPAYAAIPSMNEYFDFAPLIAGDSAGGLDRFLLGVEAARNSLNARLPDCPLLPAWDDMQAIGCHWTKPEVTLRYRANTA